MSKISHELQDTWVLFYWSSDEWNNIKTICEISTIENFWEWMNNLPKPKEVRGRQNFAFFKKGIRPVWEDSENINGGKWNWFYNRENRNSETHWMQLMLLLIGKTIKNYDEIFGITLSTRPGGDRMSLWTRGTDKKLQICIGTEIKETLKLKSLQFKCHQDSMKINSCYQTQASINL